MKDTDFKQTDETHLFSLQMDVLLPEVTMAIVFVIIAPFVAIKISISTNVPIKESTSANATL